MMFIFKNHLILVKARPWIGVTMINNLRIEVSVICESDIARYTEKNKKKKKLNSASGLVEATGGRGAVR